ncbi:F0F1 ATP synthase subunit A [Reichenbachiella agarivorans]|uniref:ATP synthase subunit a n=1 Tax=Reichenbachiella agarivorans TaxID=2979464 RepID=A0ABY6CTC5_9BACT|nr:F0F1 ATP synthase subunit A [Reichenbachiella agarivorans]UXP33767.1 F0F1 ATP synthase subunit A [Reichenbachiella agarivorans]
MRNIITVCKQLKIKAIAFVLVFVTSTSAFASDAAEGGAFDPGAMITHHIGDDYIWHFFDGHYGTVYLPVILFTDHGLEIFSSKNFYDEAHNLVEYNGYKLEHGHIAALDGSHPLDFSITKNVASLFLSAFLLIVVFLAVARGYKNPKKAPKGIQSFFEPIIIFIRDEIAIPNIGEKQHKRFLPFLLTLFFFIWFNNLLGLMPGGANLTGNISVTFVLACIVLIVTLFSTKKYYWKHIFATPGVPWPVLIILIPIELVGILTKPFSLMVRLFANITAGHIIILSLFSLIFIFESYAVAPVSVAFALFMNFLELFVALLQAYVFTLLSAMYFGSAVEEGHH